MITIYTYNGNVVKDSTTGKWFTKPSGPGPGPGPLPPIQANTVRVRTNDGNVPYKGSNTTYETATLVTGTTDIYDVYKSGVDFGGLLSGSNNVIEIIGANTTGITKMNNMFRSCTALTTIALFDTSSVTNVSQAFYDCVNVERGALALYQQMSTQTTPPSRHTSTFANCGSNTTTGAAELAQIDGDWK